MRIPFRRRHDARGRRSLSPLSYLLTLSSLASAPARAVNFTPAPPSNVDLSQLGNVGILGDYEGVSMYLFEEQNENPFSTNGSQALLARMPNGVISPVVRTDASVMTMCSFVLQNGTMSGVVMGGNFTSLAGMQSTGIALFNPNSSQITPLSGLSGQVNAVLCDSDRSTVYVGGNFKGLASTNAIAWVAGSGWQDLPFSGFNGPVTSIAKAANGNIIFGGVFTGLGNASIPTAQQDGQVINLSNASITSGSSSAAAGFGDPKNIICKTSGADGAGNTWLLQDQTPGFWEANFDFGFQPTKLRLWNTHQDGRGTKTWRFTRLADNGIMNFTYVDPATGRNSSCTNQCPLSSDKKVTFQDFHFVNVIGMSGFRLDISDWYGSGGGLNGIELFENDIFTYAIDRFNEPSCSGSATLSSATASGPWRESPSLQSQSKFLTAQLQAPITSTSASVVFTPDIRESGNYSVNMYTPGCMQDNTCTTRGQVSISMSMVNGKAPTTVQLFQTNNFDKYDQIYFGQIDATSGSFRPTVTLTPLAGQSLDTLTVVAQRVGFTQLNSTGGLNGLFEYDGTKNPVNTTSFSTSAFDKLGATFESTSAVTSLVTAGDVTYIGGNFSSPSAANIVSINAKDSTTQAVDGGLDGPVSSLLVVNDTSLFAGGRFSATKNGQAKDLNNCAVYDTSKNAWSPLGAGVDGTVMRVVAMTMNITGTTPEVVVALTGSFTQLLAFGSNAAVRVDGFAVWVPSQGNWFKNLKSVEMVDGVLLSSLLNVGGADALYGGSLTSATAGSNGAATLSGTTIGQFPVRIQPKAVSSSSSGGSVTKRDTLSGGVVSGVVTGLFDTNNGRDRTILGGHFSATASNGSTIENLVFIDNKNNNNAVTGLGPEISPNSTFLALAVYQDTLFAGGNVTGTISGAPVNGLITYNLASNAYNTQPPSLSGGGGGVTAIASRPNSGDVYVGGTFMRAGSLGCPGVCYFSTSAAQWNRPGTGLTGGVHAMIWTGDSTLVAGGTLTVNGSASTFLATYDAGRQTWDTFPGAGILPGPVDVMTAGSSDGSQVWVAGSAANGSVYLMKYDGKTWNSAGATLAPGTNIRSLQIFSLSANHDSTPLIDGSQVLMLTGLLNIPGFGNASAAVFNGTTFEPYALTTGSDGSPGSIARIFVQNQNFFSVNQGNHLPLVAIVLIALGISLFLMLLIVAAGLILDRIRKKREGYMPAPTSMYDRGSGMERVPPRQLLEGIGRNQGSAPTV